MLALDFIYSNPDNLVVFPDNHDMSRFSHVDENFDLFKIGIAIMLPLGVFHNFIMEQKFNE